MLVAHMIKAAQSSDTEGVRPSSSHTGFTFGIHQTPLYLWKNQSLSDFMLP